MISDKSIQSQVDILKTTCELAGKHIDQDTMYKTEGVCIVYMWYI